MFYLKLKSEKFSIPEKFRFLSDVNPDIFEELKQRKQYEVKSDVTETVFQSFINYWVHRELPSINQNNIIEYHKLSKEFDQMKDIIQMYINNDIILKNQKLREQLIQKSENFDQQNSNYDYIIESLFSNDDIDSLSKVKYMLFNSCMNEDVKIIDKLTKKKFIIENDLLYILNEKKKTAGLLGSLSSMAIIIIPRSVIYEGDEFIINKIIENSFKKSNKIDTIEFAEDSELISIGKEAFSQSSLQSISIPSSVIEICENAFSNCRNLTNCKFTNELNSNLIVIKKYAFANSSLQNISMPSSLTEIEEYAFSFCDQLREISFPDTSELKLIGESAFRKSSLQIIYIPSKVTKIMKFTFSKCKCLKIVSFYRDSQLKTIEKFAFYKSAIENLIIPKDVDDLEEGWAAGTPYLNNILIKKENDYYQYYDNKYIIKKWPFNVLEFAKRNIDEAKIPSFIRRISSYAFNNCDKLKIIEFPYESELESIGKYAFMLSSIDRIFIPSNVIELSRSFCSANKLIDISVSSKNNNFLFLDSSVLLGKSFKNSEDFDVIVYAKKNIEKVSIPSFVKRIGPFAFNRCTKLKHINISNDSELTSIGNNAFSSCPFEEISIPSYVNKIGKYCFYGCKNLRRINLNKNSLLIKQSAFAETKIESFYVPPHVIQLGQCAFGLCPQLKIIEISENSHLNSIDPSIFFQDHVIIMIPPNLSHIVQKKNLFKK